jgi:glucosylceramidase
MGESSHRVALLVVLIAVALTGAIAAGPAQAGVVTERGPGTVSVPGLDAVQQRAIALTSVTAVDGQSLGLVVTATFKGNIQRYLGQDELANAMLALVLAPRSRTQAPAGLVDTGGGFDRVEIALVGRNKEGLLVGPPTADVFSPEHVLRATTREHVDVIRQNHKVIFYVSGPALAQATSIKLKVFAHAPITAGASLSAAGWHQVVASRPAEVAQLALDTGELTRDQLTALRTQLRGVLASGIQPELGRQAQARAALKTTAGVGLAALKAQAADLLKLTARVNALIRARVSVTQTDPGLAQYLSPLPGLAMSTTPPAGVPVINVDPQVRYQQFSGVGAAMTDSSAWLIGTQLSPANRLALMQALFGAPGLTNALGVPPIGLNFLRVPIGASGAMTVGAPYTYDDLGPGQTDPSLGLFSIDHDLPYMIPTLQQALAIKPGLEILANPWSPPAWMKSNDALDNAQGNATLLPSAYGPLASYFVKFIQAYEQAGVPIDEITPQNEPSSGDVAVPYPGLTLPEPDEQRLINRYLAPALRSAGLSTKIYGSDLAWDRPAYAQSLVDGPAGDNLAGIAWHCYFGAPAAMSDLHQATPAVDQIVDECAPEIRTFGTPEFLISSLRNWARVVSVWSVALDPTGDPIEALNDCPGCRGPVTINEQTHAVSFRPEYYQLGQVSAFVQPGAQRIDSQSLVSYGVNGSDIETVTPGLDDVAFLNPDGSKVLVAYNNSTRPITFAVASNGSYFSYKLPARAMTTFQWS